MHFIESDVEALHGPVYSVPPVPQLGQPIINGQPVDGQIIEGQPLDTLPATGEIRPEEAIPELEFNRQRTQKPEV